MAPDGYADRGEWPRYWRLIRIATVWAVVAIVVVGGAAFLPRPEALPLRIIMELLVAGVVVAIATRMARRVEAWWEKRRETT